MAKSLKISWSGGHRKAGSDAGSEGTLRRRTQPRSTTGRAWTRPASWLATLLGLALVTAPNAATKAKEPRAGKDKLDIAVAARATDPGQQIPVIVTMKPGRDAAVGAALKAAGRKVKGEHTLISAVAAELNAADIAALAESDDVAAVSYDAPVTSSGLTTGVTGTALNSPYSLRATLGLDATTLAGSGVTVAVIDSGIHPAADFDGKIVAFRDFTRGGVAVAAFDEYGHGTHVAGIMGGRASEVPGIGRSLRLVGLRVLDRYGAGSTSNVVAAIQWAIANRNAYAIDIINLSLGHPIYEPAATDPLVRAVEAAVRAGIVVVVAAGNVGVNPATGRPGYGGITSPGNAPSAISVGSVRTQNTTRRTDDVVAEYSSRGPTWYDGFAKPDLVAPGHRVLAAGDQTAQLYQAYPALRGPSYNRGKEYLVLSGTSMAAPAVSGTVALMLEAARAAFGGARPSPNALKAMLMQTAFPMADAKGVPYDALTQGAGALNPAGAVALAGALDPRVTVGSWALVSGVSETSVVDGQTIGWGQNIVWGANIVWGDALYTNRPAWASNVVWGDNIVWGNSLRTLTAAQNIVWGTNIVWGANIVWGNSFSIFGTSKNIVWGTLYGNRAFAASQSVLTSLQ